MANASLKPLTDAITARRQGRIPKPSDLQFCRRHHQTPINQLHCWNGVRSDRPECGQHGSQNIEPHAATGLGDWLWLSALGRIYLAEGYREHGCPSDFYYRSIVGDFGLAQRELERVGFFEDADVCRRVIRGLLAWDCIGAIPFARTHDEMIYGGKKIEIEHASDPKAGSRYRLSVASFGMRVSTKGRAKLTSEDSRSETLAIELASPDGVGLTHEETAIMRECISGNVESAKQVVGWMIPLIHTPDTVWKARIRRVQVSEDLIGTESIYLGDWPNSMKPMITAAQVTSDGLWRGMRPSPRTKIKGWAPEFEVHIEDGVIYSSCISGKAELPELNGRVIWEVNVNGKDVDFRAG